MTACTNFNHHQTNITKQISQDCPLQHTHNRVPKRAEMNPLSRIIITPDTVPKFVIPRNRPTRLVTRPTSEITSDDAISDCASFNTNDRPSLPHLRMKRTPYGFSFLAESPKTSRKESLYRKKNKYQATEQNLTVQQIDYDTFIAGSLDGMYDWSSTSPSSRGSLSPASSPLVHKNCISKAGFGLSSSQSHGHLGNSNPVQNRPMSFPSTPTLIRASTMMHVNPNAMQTSSSVNRRASMPLLGDIKYQKKRSRSLRALQPDMLHLHCMRRRSVVRDLGEVHLKLQYIRQRDYLDVEVIRAENLGGSVYTGPINPILKLSLTPEKNHPKYKTINMKGTRDPQFNQNFSYTNIKPLQLMHLNLRIKVLSKKSNLRRAEHIGDIIQPLNFLIDESIHEIKANVKPCLQYTENNSTLTASLCLNRNNLMITIVKAEGLARCPIGGSPDPYVNIEVTESKGEELNVHKHQTTVRRAKLNPVFKEAFSIPLASTTTAEDVTVLLLVRDKDYILQDSNIGHVRLGVGMTTNEHVESWEKVFKKPGQSVTIKCKLCTMPIDD